MKNFLTILVVFLSFEVFGQIESTTPLNTLTGTEKIFVQSGESTGNRNTITTALMKAYSAPTAVNGLRVTGGNVVRGSNSATATNSSEFTSSIFNHLSGFSDNWIGAAGSTLPVLNINNNGVVRFNSDDDSDVGVLVYRFNPANQSVYQGVPANSAAYTTQGQYGTVSGGQSNLQTSIGGTIAGGAVNSVSGDYGAVGGGSTNTNSGAYGVIGGGLLNTVSAFSGVAVGGFLNNSTSTFTFVGAGSENTASASAAAIVAGSNNVASGAQSFIGSGTQNTTSGLTAIVVGGQQNKATADNALVLGGFQNTSSAYGAIIVGGQQDTVSGANGFNAGGFKNKVSGIQAFNGTGDNNIVSSQSAFNGAGSGNSVVGDKGFNGAGEANTVSSNYQANFGMNNIAFTGQTSSGAISRTDLLFTVGNGDGASAATASNAFTMLKNGHTQINGEAVYPKSQSKSTPGAVLDIVSTTTGVLVPRLTSAQITTLLGSLNLTTDVTGGADGVAYSKKGMMVECVDCTSLDGSTEGVTMKLYPNVALTAWVAKKLW